MVVVDWHKFCYEQWVLVLSISLGMWKQADTSDKGGVTLSEEEEEEKNSAEGRKEQKNFQFCGTVLHLPFWMLLVFLVAVVILSILCVYSFCFPVSPNQFLFVQFYDSEIEVVLIRRVFTVCTLAPGSRAGRMMITTMLIRGMLPWSVMNLLKKLF